MKKVKIDVFDPVSIDNAIKELHKYKVWELKQRHEFMYLIADFATSIAQEVYGPSVRVHWKQRGYGEFSVIADGMDVCFLEFGAGAYADPSHPFAENAIMAGVRVWPGGWSETDDHEPEGKQTWSKWVYAGGNSPWEYPYNTVSQPGLLFAYEMIVQRLEALARGVFNYD